MALDPDPRPSVFAQLGLTRARRTFQPGRGPVISHYEPYSYQGPPSRTEKFVTSFGRTVNPILQIQDMWNLDSIGPKTPFSPAFDPSRGDADIYKDMVRTPEGLGALAGMAVPWGRRGQIPIGMDDQLMRFALKQDKASKIVNQAASMDRPNYLSATMMDQYGVPIEAYHRPPPVERMMSPGDLTLGVGSAHQVQRKNLESLRRVFEESDLNDWQRSEVIDDLQRETGWIGPDASRADVAEAHLDAQQEMVNRAWDSIRSETVARARGGYNPATGKRRGVGSSASRRPWQIPFGMEQALRQYLKNYKP